MTAISRSCIQEATSIGLVDLWTMLRKFHCTYFISCSDGSVQPCIPSRKHVMRSDLTSLATKLPPKPGSEIWGTRHYHVAICGSHRWYCTGHAGVIFRHFSILRGSPRGSRVTNDVEQIALPLNLSGYIPGSRVVLSTSIELKKKRILHRATRGVFFEKY